MHQESVEALEEAGILEGTACGRNRFCPDEPIPRWAMAVWLVRLLDGAGAEPEGTPRFADVDPERRSAPFIERLAELEVTLGCRAEPELEFCPDEAVTRAQLAAFLNRALQLPAATTDYFDDDNDSHFQDDINRLARSGITRGCGTDRYCPAEHVTRAQMASFLARALQLLD